MKFGDRWPRVRGDPCSVQHAIFISLNLCIDFLLALFMEQTRSQLHEKTCFLETKNCFLETKACFLEPKTCYGEASSLWEALALFMGGTSLWEVLALFMGGTSLWEVSLLWEALALFMGGFLIVGSLGLLYGKL